MAFTDLPASPKSVARPRFADYLKFKSSDYLKATADGVMYPKIARQNREATIPEFRQFMMRYGR